MVGGSTQLRIFISASFGHQQVNLFARTASIHYWVTMLDVILGRNQPSRIIALYLVSLSCRYIMATSTVILSPSAYELIFISVIKIITVEMVEEDSTAETSSPTEDVARKIFCSYYFTASGFDFFEASFDF